MPVLPSLPISLAYRISQIGDLQMRYTRGMKFVVECEVDADVILQSSIEIKNAQRVLTFGTNASGRWTTIKVVANVPDPSLFEWTLAPVPESNAEVDYRINVPFDQTLYESIIKEIQSIESIASLYVPLKNIDWLYPRFNLLYEEADKQNANEGQVFNVRMLSPAAERPIPVKVKSDVFAYITGKASTSQSLAMVGSFWREGENDWQTGKYINAFFNFYFILEGLYGKGKTKNNHIEGEFMKSARLLQSINEFVKEHNSAELAKLFPRVDLSDVPTSDQLVRLLVNTRGLLHHFQNNPNREQGSPLAHQNYIHIAEFARYLAHKGLMTELATTDEPKLRRTSV